MARHTYTSEYDVRVRNASRNLTGQVDGYERFDASVVFNGLGTWAMQIPMSHPLAADLATKGNGIRVVRRVRDERGRLVLSHVPLSGPVRGIGPFDFKNQRLTISGEDDMHYLASRRAAQVVSYPYQTLVLADGPIRLYMLGETSGTNADDVGSQNRDGTYTGGFTLGQTGLLPDDPGKSVKFNGTSGYVSLPTTGLPTGAAAWSIELWFVANAIPASDNAVICGFGTASSKSLAQIYITTSGALFFGTFGGGNDVNTGITVTTGTLYHAVATYDGTKITGYVNAVAIPNSTNVTATIGTTGARIGGEVSNTRFFNGWVQATAIYNKVLTAAQVKKHYDVGRDRFHYSDYDRRSGKAETVIKAYVNYNLGPSAIPNQLGLARAISGLTIEADSARGNDVSEQARMWQMIAKDGSGLLQGLGQRGGVGYRLVQSDSDTDLEFSVFVPNDLTGGVKFSVDLGNLTDYQIQVSAPDTDDHGNMVYVGGSGDGADREFVLRADTGAISDWNDMVEVFDDARDVDAGDTTTLQGRGDDTLAESAEQTSAMLTIAPQKTLVWPRDYDVGDVVTLAYQGITYQDVVRQIDISLDATAQETITPVVASPNADIIRSLLGKVAAQQRRTSGRVSRLERAG